MGDCERDRQRAGCTGYERLLSSERRYNTMLEILSGSPSTRWVNPRGHSFALLEQHLSSRLLHYDLGMLFRGSVL